MFSSARLAHFGLIAVLSVFVTCIAVLGGRAASRASHQARLAPAFSLMSLDGQWVSLSDFRGKVVVVMFASTQCPASNDYLARLAEFGRQFDKNSPVQVLLVDLDSRADDPLAVQRLRLQRTLAGLSFPTLMDRSRKTARSYGIVTTPTVCVIDPLGELRYQGAYDDNRDERLVSRHYCQDTVIALLHEQEATKFTQSFGGAVARSK